MLPIQGAKGKGVLGGVDFLRYVFTGKEVSIGPKVVVIGGGNVAYDAARTAIRQRGVQSVCLVCLEDAGHMLADKIEIEEGSEEGIAKFNSFGPEKINLDEKEIVKSITFKKVISIFDSEGNFNPRFDEADTMTLQADTIFFTVGQASDLSFLENCGLEIEKTQRGDNKSRS